MTRILLLVASLALPAVALGQPRGPRDAGTPGGATAEDVERHVRAILAAKTPVTQESRAAPPRDGPGASEGYRALFKAVGPDGIRGLQAHPNDGVALQATWEQVKLTVPERESERVTTPDAAKLAWFVGFVEGRVRAPSPAWWADAVRGCRPYRRDHILPDLDKAGDVYHDTGLGHARAPKGTTLERDPKAAAPTVVLRVGGETARFPEGLLRKSVTDGAVMSDVSAHLTPARCYVAVQNFFGSPYRLACVERPSGKVVWQSRVWANFWGIASGPGTMYVAVTEQGGRVVVFGVAGTGFHVEAFNADDGANLFRFASTY